MTKSEIAFFVLEGIALINSITIIFVSSYKRDEDQDDALMAPAFFSIFAAIAATSFSKYTVASAIIAGLLMFIASQKDRLENGWWYYYLSSIILMITTLIMGLCHF